MKVLVTGKSGQLGRCLIETVPEGVDLVALGRKELDLSELPSINTVLKEIQPDVIINAAAYTAVDRAEEEFELATAINGAAVSELAAYCESHDVLLVQVSTDFVFDGAKSAPYTNKDTTNPINAYGQSKLAGEIATLKASQGYIVRTGWVYSEFGSNFVKKMLELAENNRSLKVVSDQVGTPTYAKNLAGFIWRLIEVGPDERIWNFSDAGVASWYDLACATFEIIGDIDGEGNKISVSPIPALNFPTPAKRPSYSILDKTEIQETFGFELEHWRIALRKMLAAYRSS